MKMLEKLIVYCSKCGLYLMIGLLTGSVACGSGTENNDLKTISTGELAELMESQTINLVDMRSDFYTYLPAHLPGAVYLHFESLRVSDSGMPAELHAPETYARIFSRLGIRKDQPVVIYSEGQINNLATFLAWILDGFGHQEIYLLDGGYSKWVAEDRPVEKIYPSVKPSAFPSSPFNLNVVTTGDVRKALNSPDTMLLDVRPPAQYRGEEGAQVRLGHIPGATNHPWYSDLQEMDSGARVFKPVEELAETYQSQGVTPDKEIILYCNTGTEASHNYMVLRGLLEYPNVKVYVPSFTAWSVDEQLPVIKGERH